MFVSHRELHNILCAHALTKRAATLSNLPSRCAWDASGCMHSSHTRCPPRRRVPAARARLHVCRVFRVVSRCVALCRAPRASRCELLAAPVVYPVSCRHAAAGGPDDSLPPPPPPPPQASHPQKALCRDRQDPARVRWAGQLRRLVGGWNNTAAAGRLPTGGGLSGVLRCLGRAGVGMSITARTTDQGERA